MVVALARLSVVPPASGKACFIDALHLLVAFRLKREVDARAGSVAWREAKLVGNEESRRNLDDLPAERADHPFIEASARNEVCAAQLDVVDQPSSMKFHVRLSFRLLCGSACPSS